MVKLSTADQTWFNPSIPTLCGVLAQLPNDDDGYVVIESGEEAYPFLQASGTWSDGFYLQYVEDDSGDYYECVDSAIPAAEIVGALVSFMDGGESWCTTRTWRKVEDSEDEGE